MLISEDKLLTAIKKRGDYSRFSNVSLSGMAFMFGLEVVGFASSLINSPDFEPLEIKNAKKTWP